MFTGIVEHLGTAVSVTSEDRTRTLAIDLGPLSDGLDLGDSISVNGSCLTVTALADQIATFQAMGETIDRTTVADIDAGDPVNLERPMPADGRFDGHIVQGHVDGVGVVRAVTPDATSKRIWIDVDASLNRYVVEKGSVTVDGVSLTVSGIDENGFEISLIPHTLAVTTLGFRAEGQRVNIEVDVLAKYVERLLSHA